MNVPGERGRGSIWLAPKEGEAVNERTICCSEKANAAQFERLKENERITVGGVPDDVTIRDSSAQFAGRYEHRIRRCVIES